MCVACIITAISSLLLLIPGRSTHQTRQATDFVAMVANYLPKDERGSDLCQRLRERVARAPVPIVKRFDWQRRKRPNEERLMIRAERAAGEVFEAARAALLPGDGGARPRAFRTLTDFYASLGSYPGEAGRGITRAAVMIGSTTIPLSLIAAGFYVAEFPELCGAAPGLFGGHLAHVLVGTGAVGLTGVMALNAPSAGRAWFADVGTAEADQARGARRAEEQFWRTLVALWQEDPLLSDLVAGPPEIIGPQLLRRLDGPSGGGVLEACEDLLKAQSVCQHCTP